MKKNLLTLAFVFSFVFFGLLATNIEASTGSMTNIKKIQNVSFYGSKLVRISELTNKFNKTVSQFKKVCVVNLCDDMIQESVFVADAMIAACDYNEGSTECGDAQAYVEMLMVYTMDVCSRDGPTAKVLEKIKSFPFLAQTKQTKKRVVLVNRG